MKEATFNPQTNPYKLKKPRIPVHQRESANKDFDQELGQYRKQNPKEFNEMDDCTFRPKINKKRGGSRSVDDLLNWGERRNHGLIHKRMKSRMKGEEETFSPELNNKSRKMMKGKRNGPVHDRLMGCGEEARKKRKKKIRDERSRMFSPKMGKRTRQIVAEIEGHVIPDMRKKDNGKTKNIDFYEIVPKGYAQATLSARGTNPCKIVR